MGVLKFLGPVGRGRTPVVVAAVLEIVALLAAVAEESTSGVIREGEGSKS